MFDKMLDELRQTGSPEAVYRLLALAYDQLSQQNVLLARAAHGRVDVSPRQAAILRDQRQAMLSQLVSSFQEAFQVIACYCETGDAAMLQRAVRLCEVAGQACERLGELHGALLRTLSLPLAA